MAEHASTSSAVEPAEQVAAVLAQYASSDDLIAAARKVRDAGLPRWDCHSPYPVHGIDPAMGIRRTILPWLVMGAGLTGAAAALLMQWWTNAVDYPYIISGKPLFSVPANIPITFELIVLFAGIVAFLATIVLNNLPRFGHPVLRSDAFRRATNDGFFLSIEADSPAFDEEKMVELLRSTGAVTVETIRMPQVDARLPSWLIIGLVVIGLLALLPPLWIAKVRASTADLTRFNIVSDMDYQPKFKPQAPNPMFADGRASRLPVPGTIAVGDLDGDPHQNLGKQGADWAKTFPQPVNDAMVRRGQQRFVIYCAPCHGLAGEGDGIVSKRALTRADPTWIPPLSLHVDSVKAQPVGQIFNTITNGVRKMPAYGPQISVDDRWAIVLYVRALQRSQSARLEDVPVEVRSQLR